MSERRKRLHDLLLTLINKDNEFEFIEEDSSDLTSSYSEKDTLNLSRVIEKNRKSQSDLILISFLLLFLNFYYLNL